MRVKLRHNFQHVFKTRFRNSAIKVRGVLSNTVSECQARLENKFENRRQLVILLMRNNSFSNFPGNFKSENWHRSSRKADRSV